MSPVIQIMLNQTSPTEPHPQTCGSCGSRLTGRWEKLTPGLCRSLIKFYAAICAKGINEIHLQKEVDFTKSEFTNFQKLRYFALVTKVKDKPGYWLITWQGRDFIRNQKPIFKQVYIFHNKIQERGEIKLTIGQLVNADSPYWLLKDDFLGHGEPAISLEQGDLF